MLKLLTAHGQGLIVAQDRITTDHLQVFIAAINRVDQDRIRIDAVDWSMQDGYIGVACTAIPRGDEKYPPMNRETPLYYRIRVRHANEEKPFELSV